MNNETTFTGQNRPSDKATVSARASRFDNRFTGRFVNRIDAKGRLSVPPEFRKHLTGQADDFSGVYCLPSLVQDGAIECGGEDFIDFLLQLVSNLDTFDGHRSDIEEMIYADLLKLSFDKEGRVTLPEAHRLEMGIEKEVTIIGRGNRFVLAKPGVDIEKAKRAREYLAQHKDTFRARALPSVSARMIKGEDG